MTRKQTLAKAEACVMVDRQSTHGKPEDSFGLIARLWSAYLGITIEPHTVAIMMGLLKTARLKSNPHNEDNYVDWAGYAACASELAPSPPGSFWTKPAVPDEQTRKDMYHRDFTKNNPPGEIPLPATVLHNPTCG